MTTAFMDFPPHSTGIDVLRKGTLSHECCLQPSGEIFDALYGETAQYGTPWHAYCQAVLALHSTGEERDCHLGNAFRGLAAAVSHVADPKLTPNLSGITRATGCCNYINHRDFFWPAILKTFRILKKAGYPGIDSIASQIAAIRVPAPFHSAPPGNWSAVWLNGELMRMHEGLSDVTRERFDQWLAEFFKLLVHLDRGFYAEPGLPNSYDLFTRYQLAEILVEGYDGPWRSSLEQLLVNGLKRSLAVQLSDGSQGSAYRSTGQTWTVGNEIGFFTLAAHYLRKSNPELAAAAENGARLALASFVRWFPKDRPYSAVENLLPAEWRVGFETYSLEGCYANLALGFLADAVERGFSGTPLYDVADRPTQVFIENDPVHRAFTHCGRYSAQVNAWPAPVYDAFGLVDLSFGPGRYLQTITSARHLQENRPFNVGMALRKHPGRSDIRVVGHQDLRLDGPIEPLGDGNGFSLRARARGDVMDPVARDAWLYRLSVSTDQDGIHVEESTPGLHGYKTLILPYLLDAGTGNRTRISVKKKGNETQILLSLGKEQIMIRIAAALDQWLDIPYGFENRRGLCGLLRMDLAEPTETIRYTLAVEGD